MPAANKENENPSKPPPAKKRKVVEEKGKKGKPAKKGKAKPAKEIGFVHTKSRKDAMVKEADDEKLFTAPVDEHKHIIERILQTLIGP